ncbi:MAG: class I SAM-dependent methyltransferase [Lachnospiraceae bacterium]|nr:class I SAM-dependent methyltransferase [Lachnospiraceae bacterium]MDY5522080.1 class I SAM-dependent methyltransferase [Agathobacter sp.]
MDAYTSFAQVYDLFMDNVPYEEWGAFLQEQLAAHGIEDGVVLELGCGTGRMTRIMAAYGYDMIGVDNAIDMLSLAMAEEEADSGILYLLQDMQELSLNGTVRAIYSACDCMNYILEEEGLLQVFCHVREFLDENGIFLFDMNTPYKYRELLAENTFAENRSEGSFIWENYFDDNEKINEYDLTLFIRNEDGLFEKYEETHYQRSYEMEQVRSLLEKAGLTVLGIYDAYTDSPLMEESERAMFIAKKNG